MFILVKREKEKVKIDLPPWCHDEPIRACACHESLPGIESTIASTCWSKIVLPVPGIDGATYPNSAPTTASRDSCIRSRFFRPQRTLACEDDLQKQSHVNFLKNQLKKTKVKEATYLSWSGEQSFRARAMASDISNFRPWQRPTFRSSTYLELNTLGRTRHRAACEPNKNS